ncbi:antitoxin [Massilia sp. BJB1822]
MNDDLSPIECGYATATEAEAYDRWFRSQVQKAIDDPRPSIPHD